MFTVLQMWDILGLSSFWLLFFSHVFWCEDKLPLLVKISSFKVVIFRLKFFTFLFFCWVLRGGLFFDFIDLLGIWSFNFCFAEKFILLSWVFQDSKRSYGALIILEHYAGLLSSGLFICTSTCMYSLSCRFSCEMKYLCWFVIRKS